MKKLVIMLAVLSLTMFLFVSCDGNGENYVWDGEISPFNAEQDFIYINMTIDEADNRFGEPTEVEEFDSGENPPHMVRVYENVELNFIYEFNYIDQEHHWKLVGMSSTSSELVLPIRGIQIGDSLESVLAMFPDEDYDMHTYEYPTTEIAEIRFLYGGEIFIPSDDRPIPPPHFPEGQFAFVVYSDGSPQSISFNNNFWLFSLELDDNQNIASWEILFQYI